MADSFQIKATWDSRQIHALLLALEPRQWQFATALALTRTGQRVKTAEVDQMRTVFDRPTPFTLNSLRLQTATRQHLEARVWFKDPPKLTEMQHYLLPEVYGGERRLKRFEMLLRQRGMLPTGKWLVPASGAPLDAYGNVPRGIYSAILSQLQAQHDPIQNTSAAGRKRLLRSFRPVYFYGNPGGRGRGIWQRTKGGQTFGTRFGSSVVPIFLETSQPRYISRFDFFGVAQHVADLHIGPEFDNAAAQTLATARRP